MFFSAYNFKSFSLSGFTSVSLGNHMSMFFFRSVRAFYVAVVEKMIQRFPFGNPTLTDMAILNPDTEIREGCKASSGNESLFGTHLHSKITL